MGGYNGRNRENSYMMTIKELKKLKPERIPPLPSRRQILTCYNKYRKGYHYLDDVIELRSIVLPVAKVFLSNTEKFKLMWDYYDKNKDRAEVVDV